MTMDDNSHDPVVIDAGSDERSDSGLDPIAVSLGNDIRGLRKTNGLTLSDLARKTGRSIGFLSQVERGLKKPSVGTLQSIGDALGIGIGWFFQVEPGDEHEERDVVVRRRQRRRITYTPLHSTDYLGMEDYLLSPDLNREHGLVLTEYESGASSGDDLNGHEGEESGYVVSGVLLLDHPDRTYRLEAGDSFHFRSDIPHRFRNPGPEKTVTVMALVPMALRYGHAHGGGQSDDS
jgi:transcriptional regulator with XRE-family HTH domain